MESPDASRALLVIGDGPEVLVAAERLAPQLQVVAFAPYAQGAAQATSNLRVVGGRITCVAGRAGAFRASAATGNGQQEDVGCFSPHADGRYDLVLDLGRSPVIGDAVQPHGYFAPRDAAGIAAALAALPRLVPPVPAGAHLTFETAQCAHGRQGLVGCTRCEEVCDAGAIRFEGGGVWVDADTCNGCAACTLACPTGALSAASAPRDELLASLQAALRLCEARHLGDPTLVVHARGVVLPALPPAPVHVLEVPELPMFGDELWLAAWAAGFRTVLLVEDGALAPGARRALQAALEQASALAAAAGRHDLRVARIAPSMLTVPSVKAAAPSSVRRTEAMPGAAKRDTAVTALLRIARTQPGRPAVLPAGAGFGALRVNANACTLCLACVNACPTGALTGRRTGIVQRLMLGEASCIQCGLCTAACPEHAMVLTTRVTIAGWTGAPTELAQDTMVRCDRCRAPFITSRLQDRVSTLARSASGPAAATATCSGCRAGRLFSG